MFNFVRILLAGFVLFSSGAFAQEYYYTFVNKPERFASASQACASAQVSAGVVFSHAVQHEAIPNNYRCYFKDTNNNNSIMEYQYANRRGDSCPEGQEFDAKKGECVPPPHQCEVGDVIGPYKYPGVLSGGFVTPVPPAPTSACKNGCEYSRSSKSSGCQSGVFGTFCTYTFTGTGVDCTSSPDNDMGGDSGEGPNANDGGDGGQGPGDGSDGDNEGDGGDENNGDGQDDFPEAPETSTAEGDAKESTLQEVKSVLGTLSKEDTSKKIEKGTKDIGVKIGETNKLLGELKDAVGKIPGGGGSGSGNGEGEGSSVVGGDFCDVPPVCTGDAIQCAILDQQYITRCNAEDLYDYDKHKDKIDDLFHDPKFELKDPTEVELSSFVTGHTRWLSATCPADETMSLRTNGGRTFSLSYVPLCNAADSIAPLIVIIATLLATLYVGRGAGG